MNYPTFTNGQLFDSKTHGQVEFTGMDTFCGETTYRFRSHTYDCDCYWLPKALGTHLDLPAAAPTGFDAEFLSKRLARVAALAGVPMPDMTHEQIAEAAGTILGQIATNLAKASHPSDEQSELGEWRKLKDEATLHINLLRGFPAKLSESQLKHLLGEASQPSAEDLHDSDCSVHNGPAYPAGPCTCKATRDQLLYRIGELEQQPSAEALVLAGIEAVVKVIEGGAFLHDESPEARNARALVSRIRALDKQQIIASCKGAKS